MIIRVIISLVACRAAVLFSSYRHENNDDY